MRNSDTILVVSSEPGIRSTVDQLRANYGLDNLEFIYLIEDYLDELRDVGNDVFLIRDFAVPEQVDRALDDIARKFTPTRVVFCDEFALRTAALANERWKLSGLTLGEARKFRDKKRMKEVAVRAGIRTPVEVSVQDALAELVSYPLVAKPRSLAGAMGVSIIENRQQLLELDVDWSSEFIDMDKRQYMLEQYNPKPIYHVDCVSISGEIKFLSVGGYIGKPIDFQYEKLVGTASVTDETVEMMWRPFAEKVLAAFDAPDGAYHIEAFAGADGEPELLEIGYRPGGATIVEMVEMMYGLNLKQVHFAAQLGLEQRLSVQQREEAYGYLTYPKKHSLDEQIRVTRVDVPPVEQLSTLRMHAIPTPGDSASGEFYCYTHSLGSFVFCGNQNQVRQDLEAIQKHYRVITERV